MSAVLRISTGSALDNLFQGAIIADVDIETGIVITNGINRLKQEFENHPVSYKIIKGFQIPHWEEIIEMVNKLNTVVPNAGYIGWDIGITDDRGIIVIEGNNCADHDVPQLAKRTGLWIPFKERIM